MTLKHIGLTLAGALIATAGLSAAANTDEKSNESKTKLSTFKKKNAVDGNIDEEVTNARMRATSGSRSKYSLSTSLSWLGGIVEDPFSVERPNLVGDPNTETATSLGGSFSGRYRWTKNSSVRVGFGASVLTPTEGNVGFRGRKNQANITNPFIGYSYVGKVGRFQTINSVDLTLGTSEAARDVSNVASLSWGPNFLTTLKSIPLTLGLAGNLEYDFYDSGVESKPKQAGFTTYRAQLFPYMEYAFSEKYQFRTVFGYFNWRHAREDESQSLLTGLRKQSSYQSTGINMILTRDIFLYPFVQNSPDQLAMDKTIVGMSATLNLF